MQPNPLLTPPDPALGEVHGKRGKQPTPYYEGGGVTIYHGEALDILRQLPGNRYHGIITDPPYSSGGIMRSDRNNDPGEKYRVDGTIKQYASFTGDNRDQRSFEYWCALWLTESLRVTREGGVLCQFTDWRQLPTTTDAVQAGGWVWRGIGVWDKTESAKPEKGRFRHQAEYFVWGSRGPLARDEGPCLPGVFRFSAHGHVKFHLTGKPVQLMQRILEIIPPGGTVLDPFAGSCSTGVAARNLGLQCVMIEREEHYCEVGAKRFEQGLLPVAPPMFHEMRGAPQETLPLTDPTTAGTYPAGAGEKRG